MHSLIAEDQSTERPVRALITVKWFELPPDAARGNGPASATAAYERELTLMYQQQVPAEYRTRADLNCVPPPIAERFTIRIASVNTMKRDMDLIREILMEIENLPDDGKFYDIAVQGHTAAEISNHVL